MTENEDYNEEELILAADEIIFACDYLSSLEIQVNQEDSKDIHLAYKKEKENNIKKFLKYSINISSFIPDHLYNITLTRLLNSGIEVE